MSAEIAALTLAVIEAEQRLNAAKQAVEQQRRPALIERLTVVRAELQEAAPKLAKMKSDIFALQAASDNLHKSLGYALEYVSDWLAAKPAVAEFLPTDPESIAWQAELERRQANVDAIKEKIRGLSNLMPLRIEGVELTQRVQGLHFEENNLLNALADIPRGTTWGGQRVEGSVVAPR